MFTPEVIKCLQLYFMKMHPHSSSSILYLYTVHCILHIELSTVYQGIYTCRVTQKGWDFRRKEGFSKFILSVSLYSWFLATTGCPNKHWNSVTNSISSFQIILWFSKVIPTEKAVICKNVVCYVHILFVYVLTAHTVVLSKTRKLEYTNRVNLSVFTVQCSSFRDIIDTSLQSFTLFIK